MCTVEKNSFFTIPDFCQIFAHVFFFGNAALLVKNLSDLLHSDDKFALRDAGKLLC